MKPPSYLRNYCVIHYERNRRINLPSTRYFIEMVEFKNDKSLQDFFSKDNSKDISYILKTDGEIRLSEKGLEKFEEFLHMEKFIKESIYDSKNNLVKCNFILVGKEKPKEKSLKIYKRQEKKLEKENSTVKSSST